MSPTRSTTIAPTTAAISPALAPACEADSRAALVPILSARLTIPRSAQSIPSVHLIGPGRVGRAFLRQLAATNLRLVAVTDSRRTLHSAHGLDCTAAETSAPYGATQEASIPAALAIELVHADIVVDCTASDDASSAAAVERAQAALSCGAQLVYASKAAPARLLHQWLPHANEVLRVGINAACGGAGAAILADDDIAAGRALVVTVVGNASTTAFIDALERGLSHDDAMSEVANLGLFEPNPQDDLRGRDTALKLCIAAQAAGFGPCDPTRMPSADASALNAALLQQRRRNGLTTRLVGRISRDGPATVAYEELPRTSPLAVPGDRVAYAFTLQGGSLRLHLGACLGYELTAQAVLQDVLAFAAARAVVS